MATKSRTIEFPIGDTFIQEYQLRRAGSKSRTVEVSVPGGFIKRLARESNLSWEEFIKRCRVVVYYGGGDELLYKFESRGDGEGENP